MPSPVGHLLAGVAFGCLVARRPSASMPLGNGVRAIVQNLRSDRQILVFGLLGVLPDIDFVFGVHSMYTHSIGAIAVVGLAALAGGIRWRFRAALAASLAYGSHALLDWLGSDTVAPIGIMALWPLSSDFYLSDGYLFMSVCRQYWLPSCWLHNALAVVRELVVLGSLVAVCLYWRLRPRRGPGLSQRPQ